MSTQSFIVQFVLLSIVYCVLMYIHCKHNNAFTLSISNTSSLQYIKSYIEKQLSHRENSLSTHIWYTNTQQDIRSEIDVVSSEVLEHLAKKYPHHHCVLIPEMTEIAISGKSKQNSELIYFTRHFDAPFSVTPCNVMRVLVGVHGRSDTETVFENRKVTITPGTAVVFDYNRSAHHIHVINKGSDANMNNLRIILKLQFNLYTKESIGRWCSNLHQRWGTYSRALLTNNQKNVSLTTRLGIVATYISTYMYIVTLLALGLLVLNYWKPSLWFYIPYFIIILFMVMYYLHIIILFVLLRDRDNGI